MKRLLVVLLVSLALLPACDAPVTTSPADEAKVHFEQGNIFLKQEAWDKAITEFSKAINLNPELEAAARVGRGTAYAWAGNYEDADNDFNAAIRMNLDRWNIITTDAYVAWGIAKTVQGGPNALDGQQAESLFDSAISSDPNNADAYTGRALMHLKEAYNWGIKPESTGFSRLANALDDFKKAIELDPEGIQGRIKRFTFKGDMAFLPNYIEANKLYGAVFVIVSGYRYYDRALEAYDKVLEVAPKDVEALVGRGNAYMGLGQYNKAIPSFNVALELAHYNADAYAGRAIAYTKDKQYDLAIADFKRAIELDDGYGQGKYGDAYTTPGLYAAYRENVIGFAPSYIDAYASRGYEFLKQREFTLAISDFTKAIEFQADESDALHPELDVSSAYAGRGISRARTGAYERAIDDFTIAVGSRFNSRFIMSTEAYIARAIAYSWTGQDGRALEDFGHAAMYESFSMYMDADAYLARGYAYRMHGPDYKGSAIADFKKFIAMAPGSLRVEEAQRYINELTPMPTPPPAPIIK